MINWTKEKIVEMMGRMPTEREVEVFNGINCPVNVTESLRKQLESQKDIRSKQEASQAKLRAIEAVKMAKAKAGECGGCKKKK